MAVKACSMALISNGTPVIAFETAEATTWCSPSRGIRCRCFTPKWGGCCSPVSELAELVLIGLLLFPQLV